MNFLHNLSPALTDFIQAGTGSSAYEHALVWALVAVVCILVIVTLL
ncbi:hypothetical protein [Massilia sp. SYSU DXS3249]